MNIIERIKNIFKKQKYEALPEANQTNEYINSNKNQHINRSWILKRNKDQNVQPQVSKIDSEIDRFLKAYYSKMQYYISNQMPNKAQEIKTAYEALTQMNARSVTQEEYNNNFFQEQELLNNVYSGGRYTVECQINHGEMQFIHVKSKGHQMPRYSNMVRVYINCNNANISELAKTILDYNTNPNFYLKVYPNIQNYKQPKSEKIVIFCNKEEVDYTMELLRYVKSIRPDLMEESENVQPFYQNVDNLAGLTYQPMINQYTDLKGHSTSCSQSTNTILTAILHESYIDTVNQIAACDPNLSYLLEQNYVDNNIEYMNNYPYIDSNYHEYLIESMKAKMKVLSERNRIYIDGLSYQQTTSNTMENNIQNNQYNQYNEEYTY